MLKQIIHNRVLLKKNHNLIDAVCKFNYLEYMTKEQFCDAVISILAGSGGSLNLNEISKRLSVRSDSPEYDILKDALELLISQNLINKSPRRRYSLQGFATSGIIGILRMEKDFGYVETENPEYPLIFINNQYLHTALDGDTVRVKLILQKKKKKLLGEIVEVINRNTTEIAGTIDFDGHFYFLIPDQKNLKIDFLVPTSELYGARHGDKVIAEFLRWDNPNKNPKAKVKEIIGRAGDPVVEYETIIKEFKLPTAFPKQVESEVKSIKIPPNRKIPGRIDLRNDLIITIDPATAKDFDDAVSLVRLENGNYKLGVHIADVSHYVVENSAIDMEAALRGNSVYLVDRVIPMLPERLSNEICSLNPDEPRYTFTVFMELDDNCNVVDYTITPSMIRSKRRYSYDEVQDIIDTKTGDNADLIFELNRLTMRIRNARIAAGSINYDTSEIKYVLNDEKFPVDVEVRKTNEATLLIEECMLLANKTVAKHVKVLTEQFKLPKPLPFLYRIHDEPKQDSLIEAMEFIKTLGYRTSKKNITPNDINELLARVKYNPENAIINQVLIRAMSKAVYSAVNIGHYGLGFSDYTHFTSPIRRYPDLIVHRLLKEYAQGKPIAKRLKELDSMVVEVGQHSSDTERAAMEAERASTRLASTIFASTAIGSVFSGRITGVVPYGVFVQLDELYCEGLLHTRDMADDYYSFDAKKLRITGRKTKKTYTLGSQVRVRIAKVNIEKRQIDLVMVSGE